MSCRSVGRCGCNRKLLRVKDATVWQRYATVGTTKNPAHHLGRQAGVNHSPADSTFLEKIRFTPQLPRPSAEVCNSLAPSLEELIEVASFRSASEEDATRSLQRLHKSTALSAPNSVSERTSDVSRGHREPLMLHYNEPCVGKAEMNVPISDVVK